MTAPHRPNRSHRLFVAAAALLFAALPAAHALTATEWKNRQAVEVPAAGIMRLALPPETLDAARSNQEDLRLIDPSGRETPYLLERARRPVVVPLAPKSFRVALSDAATQITVETGGNASFETIGLETPALGFIKAARVEVSADGEQWQTAVTGAPLFRQSGAERLQLRLDGRIAAFVRITLDDTRSRPVPFTGARLVPMPQATVATVPLSTRLVRREEFAGETVLTLDLGATRVPLATLEFATSEPLFTRTVTVSLRELRDGAAFERTLATGAIYRVALDGTAPSARLDVPLEFAAATRELLVHIANGDSSPLAIADVQVRAWPVELIFNAAQPGGYALLSGHNLIVAPRYDLAALAAELKAPRGTAVKCGPLTANPDYARPEPLADVRIGGAPLDASAWAWRKVVQIATNGAQELELDLDVLARAQAGFADLRLLREGRQVPYLLERPALSRPFKLALTPAHDPKRPRWSRWELKLPRARLPITRLTVATTTPFFQRRLRLYEKITDERGYSYDHTLAETDWSKTPESPATLTLGFFSPPQTDTLALETNNGDNQPLALASPQAAYAVVRLLFKADAGAPPQLYYGHKTIGPPRYDLGLVASQLLAAEKNAASLGVEESSHGSAWPQGLLASARGGPLFWGALALVVVVLLVVVAKLLPKAPLA